jgi:hypothetical protein
LDTSGCEQTKWEHVIYEEMAVDFNDQESFVQWPYWDGAICSLYIQGSCLHIWGG